MYYRANNKRGYLNARITSSDIQFELQDIDYGVEEQKDRNIPTIVDETMRLVIWGVQYPNPSADPDREIVSAIWSGGGQIFDMTRAQEGTEAGDHHIGDNVALLFTASMSREILILEDFESSSVGSIAYAEDTDGDGDMEVLSLLPDDEVSTSIVPATVEVKDSYTENIDSQKFVYWFEESGTWFAQTFTPDVEYDISGVILKLYRVIEPLICGGVLDGGYRGWRVDDSGVIQQNLPGLGDTSYASAICTNGKFYITAGSTLWKFNKDGTVDTSWQTSGSKVGFGTAIFDLALDADENLYVVNSRPASPASGDTIWKLDSNGNVIWSAYPLGLARATNSVVVGSDGYVYVAASRPTGSSNRGMKLNPANGTVLVNYNYAKANHVAVDDFGFVYLSGGITTVNIYRFANDASLFSSKLLGDLTMADIFVQSGSSAEDTKVFVAGRYSVDDKSVWKLNYNLSVVEASYKGYYSFSISEDTDGNLLIACHPTIAGEDGIYQIVKLRASDLLFLNGIKFNDAELKHAHRQGFNMPGVLTVGIRATDSGTGKPVGSDIRLGTANGDGITVDSDGEEVTFIFSEYTLVPGTKYVVILKSPQGEFAYIGWKIDESNATYAGGSAFISSDLGSTWLLNPIGGDGDFYFKTLSGVPEEEIVDGDRKILVSGGVGEVPYWQFIWADEVGGTKQV